MDHEIALGNVSHWHKGTKVMSELNESGDRSSVKKTCIPIWKESKGDGILLDVNMDEDDFDEEEEDEWSPSQASTVRSVVHRVETQASASDDGDSEIVFTEHELRK